MNDLTHFLVGHGGPVLFAIVFVEQAGLPLPSAPWLLAAGALSASGRLSPAMAIGAAALAALMADSFWFYVGRRGGQRVLRLFCRLSLSRNSCVGRTKGFFARHGVQTLVAAKFLPGLGAVMPPLAGALGMRTSRFLLFDGLGSLVYGSFYIAAGFVFHNQLGQAISVLNQVGLSALVLALAVVSGYVAFKFARRTLARKQGRKGTVKQSTARVGIEGSTVLAGDGHDSGTGLAANSLGTLQLPEVALTLASTAAQTPGSSAPAPVIAQTC